MVYRSRPLAATPDKYSLLKEITRLCLERDARSVVASRLTRDYYIENFSAEKDKLSVIPLGLDEGRSGRKKYPGERIQIPLSGQDRPQQGYPHLAPGI